MIDRHTIKLADFGRACQQGSDVDNKAYGVIPYMDPKTLDPKTPYNLTKKSDIYSLGVLFWQLTSCSSPFNFETRNDHISITLDILNGVRENLFQTQMINSFHFIKVSIKIKNIS